MNQLIPQDTIEILRSSGVSSATAKKVLRQIVKSEKPNDPIEAEIYLVLQILLSTNYSQGKITETLNSLQFPEDFIGDFISALPSIPKIRSGVVFPSLVDVNWKTIHEISTSNIRKIHAPAISIEPLIQEPTGEFRNLSFTCTKPQLAELVYKLKSALQQIDKTYKS